MSLAWLKEMHINLYTYVHTHNHSLKGQTSMHNYFRNIRLAMSLSSNHETFSRPVLFGFFCY